MNVPIVTTEHYVTLNFTTVQGGNIDGLHWVWRPLHLTSSFENADIDQLVAAFSVMRQLGIPMYTALGYQWLQAFNRPTPQFVDLPS